MPVSTCVRPSVTRAAAHNGSPRSPPLQRTKKLGTCSCAPRNGHIHRTKKHRKRPKGRRGRLVDVSRNDATQQRGREQLAEVDRVLQTCAQAGKKRLSGMLGMYGDEVAMLGLALHACLMSWYLCRAGGHNLGGTPLRGRLVAQRKT